MISYRWVLLACIMILIASGRAGAQEVDARMAAEVAKNFLNGNTSVSGARTDHDLKLVYQATSPTITATPLFYVFNTTSAEGFVIISANESTIPVLAYGVEGGFDPDNIPPHITWWLEQYAQEIRHVDTSKTEPAMEIREAWLRLKKSAPAYRAAKEAGSVNALVRTKWHQDSYYKAFCPQNSVTGCVATAMAQVMKYWNYPTHGTGSHAYHHKVYGTLSTNFSETTYAWDKMQTTLKSKNDAVAILMYQCGVSVDMNYGITASGAYAIAANSPITNCAEYAFKTYFGYTNTLRGVQRKNYTEGQWTSLLKKELDARRPVIYTGFNPKEGHTFICDGYDDKGYFHFNWGWGGTYDGYFYIDALVPGQNLAGFANSHQAIIGIEPGQDKLTESITDRIKVFPNPARDDFSVLLQEFDGIVRSMTITDMQGKLHYTTEIENSEMLQVPVDNLANGFYILRFQSDRGPVTVRIVIQK